MASPRARKLEVDVELSEAQGSLTRAELRLPVAAGEALVDAGTGRGPVPRC